MSDKKISFLPKHAIFFEHANKPEIFNESNNRIERVINELKELIKDSAAMKNIILGELQKTNETIDKNTYHLNGELEKIIHKLSDLEKSVDAQFNNLQKDIIVIKEYLTMYELDPDLDPEQPIDPDHPPLEN